MVRVEPTPNPNAVKFTVGKPVGGPKTLLPGTDDQLGTALLGIAGVTSVFMTADFVTISKSANANWDDIKPAALASLEEAFPD
ncbi:MAG TPA: NifU N-terminal domain-containing protein [Acidimicrobiia bacterium]|nr:NifU N-terminal domain-containing protein [Acidimicrobiia bacterium]